jgi:hypothetical protein
MTEQIDFDGDYEDFDDELECLSCGGEGYVSGEDLGDPLWYDYDSIYKCRNCGGSGLRKDMTCW